jgi:hypothetical protein
MNELIKELAKEAEKFTLNIPDADVNKYAEIFNTKFAELIVRECIESLWTQENMMSDLALEDFNANKQRILNYFGIKE